MDKKTIVDTLEEKHQKLFDWLNATDDDLWIKGPENRWTSGQHILHLVQSSQMLNKALRYPKFLLKYKFGTSNRPSRDYNAVAKRYEERLAESQERAKEFNKDLRVPAIKEKSQMIDDLQVLNKKLQYKTQKFKDKHLDTLLLPHPLMGRMTLREIIMWTAHHTDHHLEILKRDYSA